MSLNSFVKNDRKDLKKSNEFKEISEKTKSLNTENGNQFKVKAEKEKKLYQKPEKILERIPSKT